MKKYWKQIVITLSSVFLFAIVFIPLVSAAEENKNYSFYKIASSGSTFFSEAVAKGLPGGLEAWKDDGARMNGGVAGGLLGFGDATKTKGIEGLIQSLTSSSSASMSYSGLAAAGEMKNSNLDFFFDIGPGGVEIVQDGSTSAASQYIDTRSYVYFGAALQRMGVDRVAETGLGLGKVVRLFAGAILWLFAALASGVDLIFKVIGQILRFVNPFRWFTDAIMATTGIADFTGQGQEGVFTTLSQVVGGMYTTMRELGWTLTIPFFIALTLTGLLLFGNKGSGGSTYDKLKRLFIRVLFIGLGVPLIGGTYSATLDLLIAEGTGGVSTTMVNRIIFDFENYVKQGQMALPSGVNVQWDMHSNDITSATLNDIQNFVGKTNGTNDYVTLADGTKRYRTDILSRLQRYMQSNFFYPSDFETHYKAQIKDQKPDKVYENADTWQEVAKLKPSEHPLFRPINPNARLTSSVNGNVVTLQTTGKGAFSPIATYNYLSTEFGPTGLVIYSNEKASSGFMRKAHYSVNLAGNGILPFMWWLQAGTTMMASVLVGIIYGIGLLIANLRRTLNMIGSIPFAMLGILKSIGQVIAHVVISIVEIIATIFLYGLVSNILVTLADIGEPIIHQMTKIFGSDNTLIFAAIIIKAFVGTIIVWWFAIQAIKFRKSFVEAFEKMAVNVVDKLIGVETGVSPSAPPSALGQMAKGMAGMGAAAVGTSMMGGLANRVGFGGDGGLGAGSVATGGGDNHDPDGVASDGSPIDPLDPSGVGGMTGNLIAGSTLGISGGVGGDDKDKKLGEATMSKGLSAGDGINTVEKTAGLAQGVQGGAEIATGVGKAVVGAKTGNVGMAVDGVKDAISGAGKVADAASNLQTEGGSTGGSVGVTGSATSVGTSSNKSSSTQGAFGGASTPGGKVLSGVMNSANPQAVSAINSVQGSMAMDPSSDRISAFNNAVNQLPVGERQALGTAFAQEASKYLPSSGAAVSQAREQLQQTQASGDASRIAQAQQNYNSAKHNYNQYASMRQWGQSLQQNNMTQRPQNHTANMMMGMMMGQMMNNTQQAGSFGDAIKQGFMVGAQMEMYKRMTNAMESGQLQNGVKKLFRKKK